MVITNVKIYTMGENGIIENGYIEISNGKITAVKDGKYLGNDTDIFDANGAVAVPGFIDGHTHIGIIENGLDFEGDDCNEMTDPITPQLRVIDAINPLDKCFFESLKAGVTTVAVSPGSANAICGQIAIIKTHGKRIDNMIIKAPAAMKMALGENPKGVYHGKSQAPETRMATAALMRESLYKAQKYLADKEAALASKGTDDELDEPDLDFKCEALIPLLKREIPAHFHAHRADDIFTAIRIAKEFNLDYTIVHCTEGYLIADELKAEGATAFVGPNLCDRSKPELLALSFENPKILAENILIGITTDHPETPLEYLTLCAAMAKKNGLPEYEALKTVTVNPAKILGIDNRVGTIEIGKDADIVIIDGEPLDITAKIKAVFVDGNRI